MVLGLGSRSKKDRLSSPASHPPHLDLRLLEIRPWHGLQTPKASSSVILRCSRGDKLLGTTRSVSPKVGTAVDGGKIVFNETIRIPAAVSRDASKKLRKSSGDSERLLVFHLLETNNVKGQPLAHASLNLAAYASIEESKTIGIQLTLSRKVSSKGTSSYLHVTVQRQQDERNVDSGPVVAEQHFNPPVSSVTSASSRTSEASSPPPLDDATHQRLVEALLSDEDDEIASFTDDEISHGSGASQDNVTSADAADSRLSETTQTATISQAREVMEKRIETAEVRISQPAISSPQASPVKVAAAAAAAAYATKRSLLSRDTSSFVAASYDLSSEPASPGDDGFLTPEDGARSPNLLSKNYFAANLSSSLKSSTTGGSDAVSSSATATMVKAHEETLKVVIDEKKQMSEAYTGSRELSGEGNSVGGGVVLANPAKGDENPELGCISSKTSGIKAAPAAGNSKERVGNIASNAVKCAGEGKAVSERTSPVSEKEGSQNIGYTVKADLKTAGSNNGRAFEPSFERKPSLPNNLKNESVFDKSNKPNGDSELAKAQAGSRLEGGQVIEDKYQRKSLIETKSRVTVRASPKEDAVQEAKMTVSRSIVGNNEKLDKKSTEAAKTVVALAEAKATAAEAKVQHLEKQVEQLQGELRDVAAVEAALYTNTTEHGSSSLKVHSPARRLTRLYIYACKHWSQERRARCAENTVGGLVLVSRACGHDVARLTFWWSNTVVLRETISMAFDVSTSSPRLETALSSLKSRATSRDLHIAGAKRIHEGYLQESHITSPAAISEDWREPSTFTAALERVEAWIYAKVVESIWWQVLTPRMQQSADASILNELDGASENVSLYGKRSGKRSLTLELMDGKQGNTSIEIWKKAFLDAYERLCPVRAMGVECGCLPILIKMVLEECIVRLDVAMFNAILRGDDDEAPTDPVSDPISDARVLPIPISTLSFGIGAQLKSVVGILSAWLIDLLSKNSESIVTSQIPEDDEKTWVMFPLLKATGDLLMLPKELLQNRALRKEACPFLRLSFIGRILSNFQPDEFSPEPVTPELLEAINLEIFAENERRGELDYNVMTPRIATAPPVVYSPPQSSMVRTLIGHPKSYPGLSRSSSSLLRKGHTSDDEIDELESPILWLWENTTGLMVEGHGGLIAGYKDSSHANEKLKDTSKGSGKICRFKLLRDVWNTDLMKYL